MTEAFFVNKALCSWSFIKNFTRNLLSSSYHFTFSACAKDLLNSVWIFSFTLTVASVVAIGGFLNSVCANELLSNNIERRHPVIRTIICVFIVLIFLNDE